MGQQSQDQFPLNAGAQVESRHSQVCVSSIRIRPAVLAAAWKIARGQRVVPETLGGYATHQDSGGNVTTRLADTVRYLLALPALTGTLALPPTLAASSPLLSPPSRPDAEHHELHQNTQSSDYFWTQIL